MKYSDHWPATITQSSINCIIEKLCQRELHASYPNRGHIFYHSWVHRTNDSIFKYKVFILYL